MSHLSGSQTYIIRGRLRTIGLDWRVYPGCDTALREAAQIAYSGNTSLSDKQAPSQRTARRRHGVLVAQFASQCAYRGGSQATRTRSPSMFRLPFATLDATVASADGQCLDGSDPGSLTNKAQRYWNSSCCAQIPLSAAGKDGLLTKGQVWATGQRDLFSPIHQIFPCAPFQNIDVPSLGSFIFSKEYKSQMQGAASVMFPGLSAVLVIAQRGL